MKLSIIIPVLNAEATITRTLDSILHQGLKDCEVIVVDGGSTDRTVELISQHGLQVSLVSEADEGISDALNKGVARSIGEYLAFLNADDYWNSFAVCDVMEHAQTSPGIDIYYSDVVFSNPRSEELYQVCAKLDKMKYRMSLFHPCLIIKRKCFEIVGGYRKDYDLAMDCEWLHRAMSCGANFSYIKRPIATMSLGGLSDIHFIRALWEYRRSLLEHGLSGPVFSLFVFMLIVSVKTLKRFF